MVHLSTLFIAVVGFSLFSAVSAIVTGAVQARNADHSFGPTIRDVPAGRSYIKHINIYYTQAGLKNGTVSGDLDLDIDLLNEPVTLDAFYAHGTSGGVRYLSFDTTHSANFTSVVLPPNTTKNTGRIYNIEVKSDLTPIMKSGLIDADAANKGSFEDGSSLTFKWNQTEITIKFQEE